MLQRPKLFVEKKKVKKIEEQSSRNPGIQDHFYTPRVYQYACRNVCGSIRKVFKILSTATLAINRSFQHMKFVLSFYFFFILVLDCVFHFLSLQFVRNSQRKSFVLICLKKKKRKNICYIIVFVHFLRCILCTESNQHHELHIGINKPT